MIGVEVAGGAARGLALMRDLLSNGYVVLTGGDGSVITLTPPLNIPRPLLAGFVETFWRPREPATVFVMSSIEQAEMLHGGFASVVERGASFEDIAQFASGVALFQYENLPGYKALCDAEGFSPPFDRPFDLPAVPVDVFRYRQVCTFDPSLAEACFLTSGTTSGARGAHYFRTTRSYRLASTTFARDALFGVSTTSGRSRCSLLRCSRPTPRSVECSRFSPKIVVIDRVLSPLTTTRSWLDRFAIRARQSSCVQRRSLWPTRWQLQIAFRCPQAR